MKVFLSWSQQRSKLVAHYLKEWLPYIMQSIKPWFSPEDIHRGEQWFNAINKGISESTTGIICLTKENKDKPWILFESGALFKGIDKSRLFTLLIDIEPSELIGNPLYHFNHTRLIKEDLLKLIKDLNQLSDEPRDAGILTKMFETFWPDFEERLKEIFASTKQANEDVADSNPDPQALMLENILQAVTNVDKAVSKITQAQDQKSIDVRKMIELETQLEEQRLMAVNMRDKSIKSSLFGLSPVISENEFRLLVDQLRTLLQNRNISFKEVKSNPEFWYKELQTFSGWLLTFNFNDFLKALDWLIGDKSN
ncbi:toll/interleukin-1 receptor domain-containing protein [Mucilaginibacter sp. 21P]|uniref:toll/interleukin-1 receptor domain-containing protein n=1 Tax=Mucilaginibacter sp. 21P TaxID=2778902 RepID=UPI001C59C7D1|nr:toll/interleukin-1 receptor domain-containing protein [Mucilaginibacter sp. 21P]QXV66268.1 toll/interleukin-1 receptor domain-containing protein [Mucilaginibacter sp. 21P]